MKMKSIYLRAILLPLLMLAGCTQYNGHIGPIFGSWSLTAIAEDGDPLELADETVFSFQNEIVQVVRLDDPPFEITVRYGNFSITDRVLTMKFQHLPTVTGSHMYMTPDWLHFPTGGKPLEFEVRKLTGSEMRLLLDNGERLYEYTFKKTW